MDVRFARGPQRGSIPIPQGETALSALARGGGALADAVAQDQRLQERTDMQVERIDADIREREQRDADNLAIANGAAGLAKVQSDLALKIADLRSDPSPGAQGHDGRVKAAIDEASTAFLSTLPASERVRQHFIRPMAELAANVETREGLWQREESAKAQGDGFQAFNNTATQAIMAAPGDTATFATQLAASDALIDAMQVAPSVRAAVKERRDKSFRGAVLDGLENAGDPARMRALATDQTFMSVFSKDEVDQVLDRAGVVERTQVAAAQAAEARRLADARDASKTIDAKIDAGIIPTAGEMRSARAGLVAAGADEHELVAFDTNFTKATVNRTYATAPLSSMRRDRDLLAAKQSAGTASESEQMMLHQLDRLTDDREKKEADKLEGLAKQGASGQVAALATLDDRDAGERYAIAEKIKPGLGFVAGLNAGARPVALTGREVRAARPADFGNAKQAKMAFDAVVGPVAATMGGQYDDALNTAWDIMTGTLARDGKAGFDAGKFATAVIQVTGGTRRRNGIAQGGVQKVRGQPVWLPEAMSAPEFDQAISRNDFAGARYANGARVDKQDVLSHYRTTWAGDAADGAATYRFSAPDGGWLMGADGKPFTIRMGRR